MRQYILFISVASLLGACSWLVTPPSRVANPIVAGVHYVGVTVENLDKTQALYAESTDIQVVQEGEFADHPLLNQLAGREGVTAKTRLMKGVNAQLLFMQFNNPSDAAKNYPSMQANGPGIAHLAFQVDKKTQTYQAFLTAGATHIGSKEMMTNPKTHVSYAYVYDKDNIIVEIEHVDIDALDLPKPPKNDRRIRHISLATLDMDRAIDFYSELLETQNPRRVGHYLHNEGEFIDNVSGLPGSETEMAWFQVRNLELELIQYYHPEPKIPAIPKPVDATGYNMIVFDVTDVDAAKQLFSDAGGKLVTDIQQFNDGLGFFGRDPDGNLLGFQTIPNSSPFSAKNFKNNGIE
ncbi:VOC family protein [Paraglaciecola arctica]|uniref:VOC family protein n=1 Tax=Paraglaciecola arctica TaxID=1128911 RepID=UPI001C06B1B7|nr:VOC family protein [Paraglaciecola arctica]MBU3004519.1 VOC family protein [Paraglaciecola arctica]